MTPSSTLISDDDPEERVETAESTLMSTVTRLYGLFTKGQLPRDGDEPRRQWSDSDQSEAASLTARGSNERTDRRHTNAEENGRADGEVSFDEFTVIDGVQSAELGTDLKRKAAVIRELFGEVSNVCLHGPTGGAFDYQLCSQFLGDSSNATGKRVLVTTDQSVVDRLRTLEGYGAGPFNEVTFIVVGDPRLSGDPGLEGLSQDRDSSVTVKTVPDSRDLVRLGLIINTELDVPSDESPPRICFHHLGALLEQAELEQVFRFFHILQSRVAAAGARAHYHLDPATVSDSEQSIIDQLFDVALRFDADGSVSVDT